MTQPPLDATTHAQPPIAPRPALWRLPLFLSIVLGLGVLKVVDNLLQRDTRGEAVTQAVQADALVESFVRQRVALLETLGALVASSRDAEQGRNRFNVFAREMSATAPEVQLTYLLGPDGIVRAVFPDAPELLGASVLANSAREHALQYARENRTAAATGTMRLRDGRNGMILYIPVLRDDRTIGYVGTTVSYGSLFTDALAGQLHGRFAYRITDEQGNLIATSPGYPSHTSAVVTRGVRLPGGHEWRLEVAVPLFEPALPRLVLWTVGLLFLGLLVALVIREEHRSEKVSAHALHMELLSRSLLDANVRLEERAGQIAEANRMKSRFLANVSHELRTPINAIVGYNALALEGIYGELPDDLREANERVRRAAEHLLSLVNDVLDLSKIEVGRMDVDIAPIALPALIDGIVGVVEPSATAKGLWLDVVIGRDLPIIESDERHIRQIVINLLTNAIKFTERGSVTLVVRRESNAAGAPVLIIVEDTGIGIAPHDLGRVFEEFEQVRPSGRGDSMQRGTGLGLTISRKLAKLLGGDIRATSQLGAGSRFEVTIPVRPPAHPRSEAPVPMPQIVDETARAQERLHDASPRAAHARDLDDAGSSD